MTKSASWTFRTEHGLWRIRRMPDGWASMFEDELLDARHRTAESALENLVAGHTFWPSCGDPALCGLPDELERWRQQ